MAKVLKITKSDKTVHVAPLTNKGFYEAYNRRQKGDKKWKLEEIDEKDAANLPFMDESHVSAKDAVKKVDDLTNQLGEKDKEIEALKALLAEKEGGQGDTGSGQQKEPVVPMTAKDKIDLINAATTIDQVEALLVDEARTTVVAAGDKKIEALKA